MLNTPEGFAVAGGNMRRGLLQRIIKRVKYDWQMIHPVLMVAQLFVRLLPYGSLGSQRAALYRWAGFRGIGPKAHIYGPITVRGMGDIYPMLRLGDHSRINSPCIIEPSARVTIGKRVAIGYNVVITTSSHVIGPADGRSGRLSPRPITICDGAWIGAGAMIMPGITIGRGAIVLAGSVVTRDVPPNAKVGGNPAQVVHFLEEERGAVLPWRRAEEYVELRS